MRCSCPGVNRHVPSSAVGSVVRPGVSYQEASSPSARTDRQFLSNTRIHIRMDQGTSSATRREELAHLTLMQIDSLHAMRSPIGELPFDGSSYIGLDLQLIIECNGLCPHLYADDSQIYGSCIDRQPSLNCKRASQRALTMSLGGCARTMHLQLKSSKTEILWLATGHLIHQLPRTTPRVGADFVVPSTFVRDLGILIDSDVSIRSHVTRSASTCFSVLHELVSTIRRSVSSSVIHSLVWIDNAYIGLHK